MTSKPTSFPDTATFSLIELDVCTVMVQVSEKIKTPEENLQGASVLVIISQPVLHPILTSLFALCLHQATYQSLCGLRAEKGSPGRQALCPVP